jgi:hypothetical protein
MRWKRDEAVAVRERTPRVVRAQLQWLPEVWTHRNYGEGPDGKPTWSAYDIVGHLIHGDRTDWIPRLRIILEFGESRAFDPFDRTGHVEESRGKTLGRLLDEFDEVRRGSLAALQEMRIQETDLGRKGRHPALGTVTAENLLAMWVVHDLNHVAQICKAMAYQYKAEVGPWEAYASILAPPSPR